MFFQYYRVTVYISTQGATLLISLVDLFQQLAMSNELKPMGKT
jgi:hypothetical protein